ncbi:MAG: flagellin [Bdellovibrionia bacterium]
MGLRIMTNIQALTAQRHLGININHQKDVFEQLASGSRINKAADDAAGLAISEKLKAQIRSIRQASRNSNDGVSLIQVAEGGMNEIGNILTRMRELSIQGASDTIGDSERGFLNKEIQQLKAEVDRISNTTEFNGTKLLTGTSPPLEIQIGTHNNPLLDRFVFDSQTLGTSLDALGLEGIATDTKLGSQENLEMLDNAIQHLSGNRATVGALQNRLISTINNLAVSRENYEAANSRIRDTDFAEASSEMVKSSILAQANTAVLAQANTTSQLALKLLS